MLITKREVKQTSKKLLSVLLAVIMIMTSMSVCFGTSVFAAGKDVDVTALANALKFDSIKNADFSGTANNYTVDDPDGKILSAVEAYFAVVDAMANKTPTNETPSSGTSNIAQKGESGDKIYRTYNHLNARVKTLLQSKMGSDYTTYNVDKFITGLLAGSTVSEGTSQKTVGPDGSSNTTVPASTLSDAPAVSLTVNGESAVKAYTLADLPENVATTKTFTVSHAKTNYDYKFTYTPATESCGSSNNDQKYQHDYYFYYNYSGYKVTDGASVSTQSIKTAETTLKSYADYFTMDLATLVAKGNTTLGSVKTAVNDAKSKVVTAFPEGVFTHFFGTTYNIAALNTNIDNAVAVNNYIGIAREIVDLTAENFTGYSYDQLNSLYSALQQKINNYKPNNSTADAYIVAQTGLNLSTSNARLEAINKEMQLIKIREAKPVIDSHMATFNAYNTEQIADGTLTSGVIASALTTIKSDKTKLEGFTRSYVDEVCGSDYFSKINNCIAHLEDLAKAANYEDRFSAKVTEFINDIQSKVDVTLSTDDLYSGIKEYDGWYKALKDLVNEMKSVLGEDIANVLLDEQDAYISDLMDAAYDALNVKVKTQVDDAYVLFKAFIDTYPDGAIDFKNVSQYSAMKYSIGLINVDAYNFLNASPNVTVAQDTVKKYNELQRKFPDFDAFINSMGFSEFRTVEIEDIVRPDTIEDVARKNKDGKYVVDDEKVESVISKLDALLNNPEIKSLLGGLINKDKETGEPTGEPFDIGGMIKSLITDGLFTDSFINTVVGMLYPLVTTEFIKVWANELPPSFPLDEIKFNYILDFTVPKQTPEIKYDKNLYTVLKESPMNIFPDLLAGVLDSGKYADNIALLKQASNQFKTEFGATDDNFYTLQPIDEYKNDGTQKKGAKNTPWDSAVLKKDQLDENGNPVIDLETGKVVKSSEWALNWGVDAKKAELLEDGEFSAADEAAFAEFFYQAFDDAVEGLKPLLYALIANTAWTNTDVISMASLEVNNITPIIGTIQVTVDLDLSATANRGYANLIVPLFEVLGLKKTEFTAPGTLEGYSANTNGAADILRAILTPVFTFADKLGKNPLDTLLGILPDICYVLATQSVPKLLDMLKTSIKYFGTPMGHKTISLPFVGERTIDLNLYDMAKVCVEGGADISVGTMLDLKDMGVDLTDGINSVLAGFGMDLPDLDQGKLATLGEKTTIDTQRSEWIYEKPAEGKAYHIEANKADVLLYILDWALGNLNTLLSTLGLDLGSAGELLSALSENPDLAIAAVAELLTLGKYDTLRNFEWFNGTVDGESVVGNSAAAIYLNPNNDWTKDKATYLYNNIDDIVSSVLTLAKLDLDKTTPEVDGSLGGVIDGAIGGLLSDATLTSLAALLAKLDLNALLAPKAEEGEEEAAPAVDVNELVKNLLGVDLSEFAVKYGEIAEKVEATKDSETPYVHDFGVDKGKKTFAEALTEMLAPLDDVLAFILKGGDLIIDLEDDKDIVLPGYDGYNNAIIPILEALGCEVKASAEVTDALGETLTALLNRIDALTTGDVIKNIIDLLPGVFYFIASKGLSVSVRNLLQPVYVILDTIRPIIDVDLNELINGLLPEDSGMGINIDDIGLDFLFQLLETLIPDLDLSELKDVIYDICVEVGTDYSETAKSTLQADWKKGAYSADFDQADLLTVVLSFVLEWATVKENAEKLDELLKTDGIIASLNKVFADVEIIYGTPNWAYWFENDEDAFNAYLAGDANIPNTLAALDWSSVEENIWNLETAKYFAENVDELVDLIIEMINKDKVDDEGKPLPTNLSDLLNGLVNGLVNADTINDLVGMITGLLEDVDENLLEAAGILLSGEKQGKVDIVGLKAYTCTAEIKSVSGFINELADVLDTYASGLINWLFFGDSYEFAKKSDKTDTIVINGGLGYEKGLAMILEALGCELPEKANTKSVLGALATRVDEILADPINKIIELLPNLIYFLNANGAGVAVDNILQPVYALLDKLSAFGLNVNLADLLKITKDDGTEIVIDLENLSLENVVTIVEGATGLPLDAAEAILVDFCTGKITEGEYIYKMEAASEDVITILLVVACELIYDDAFAAKLDEMLGTNFVAQLKNIFSGSEIIYKYPEWNYMDGEEKDGVIEYVNAITSYPNDWTEEKAEYLTENLPALVDSVIRMVEINGVKYDSLVALLQANVNIFTTETLNSLLDLIRNLLGNIDAELLEVGFIIDVDLEGLMTYEVPEGIDTVKKFADELATILTTYAKGAVEWLLLGRDFELLVKDADGIDSELVTEGSYIELNGAHGYAEGLALLLEALGCKDLPAVYDVENLDTKTVVEKVLTSLAERVEAILNKPVEEVLDLLPNLIYFLDADGVDAVITNTTAALTALVSKLSVLGIELDINSLVNLSELMGIADKYAEGDDVIALNNLTLKALLKALSLMTELDFTELENVLVPFALGEAVKYDSVSASDAYKMVYKTDLDKHDMVSVIVTAALRFAVENEDNAAKLDKMIGTEIISALKDVFAGVDITYAAPEWEYPLAENGTVDAMKYSITYPNNWTEATAKYVTDNLPEIGDLIAGLIDSNYDSLSALLKANVNVFTGENLQAIVDLITKLLEGIDDGLLDAAGVLLGADVVELKKYKAPKDIDTVEEFAAELANVLNTYAKGVVEWLLLGNDYTFFVKEVKGGVPVDFITINGANGYAEGLALLLEALGCENLPATDAKTEDIVTGVLNSVAALINKVLDKPVETVVNLLPNILYFLNANGVAAVVDNTLAAVTALLTKLEVFGVNVNINELVNLKSLMGLEDTDAAISLDNLSLAAVLEAVSLMVGLDLTLIEDVLVGFALGQVNEYDSASASTAYKMTYKDEFDKHDMVTVLVNLVLLTITDEENAEFVKDLVGEDVYAVIVNLCNGVAPVEIQEFDWKFTDKADTGEVFSSLDDSELYQGYGYGPLYTKEMAEYIADNFGTFVDNILYLLGLEINGITVNSLTDLIDGLLNGSLYNSSNVIAIRDALAGVLDSLSGLEVNGKNVGKYIVAVLENSDVADIAAVAKVEIPEFTEDRAKFVEYLCAVLEPLYPVLKWVLADEDIAFFVDLEKEDLIKLEGAEGYAYGIIPLLETLECKDVLAPADYYAAVKADGDVLLTSILNPLLNRVDEIAADDAASAILAMLPNIIYFINSNGVDTVIKNTLNAVYTLLSAIKPIAEIDLYELLGLEFLETLDFETIFQMLLDLIADATGYKFENLEADAVAELTVGTLESYTSLNTKTAYRMVYDEEASKADMVTVILRLLVTFVMHENNREMLLGLLKDNLGMDENAEGYFRGVLDSIASLATNTYLGMDQALAVIYYLFYSADIGSGELAGGIKDINAEWKNILKELSKSENPDEITIGDFIGNFLDKYLDDVFTSDGFAPNGLIAFFKKIINWFNSIIEWFKKFMG